MRSLELSVNLNKIWLLGDMNACENIVFMYFDFVKRALLEIGSRDDIDNLVYQLIYNVIDDYFTSKNPYFDAFLKRSIKMITLNKEKVR